MTTYTIKTEQNVSIGELPAVFRPDFLDEAMMPLEDPKADPDWDEICTFHASCVHEITAQDVIESAGRVVGSSGGPITRYMKSCFNSCLTKEELRAFEHDNLYRISLVENTEATRCSPAAETTVEQMEIRMSRLVEILSACGIDPAPIRRKNALDEKSHLRYALARAAGASDEDLDIVRADAPGAWDVLRRAAEKLNYDVDWNYITPEEN